MATIVENLDILEVVKDDIKEAIESKGVVIDDSTPFTDYATKIDEISSGSGDYQDGYIQGKADQKALLENRTFHRNGTYSRPDGYGTVIVDVPNSGGTFEEAYEQGKADQKALMTTGVFNNNGTFTREDGWNEVIINYELFDYFTKTLYYPINSVLQMAYAETDYWTYEMDKYNDTHPDLTSNGMMFELPSGTNPIFNLFNDFKGIFSAKPYFPVMPFGKKTLVTPWVYNVNNSPSTIKILPDYWIGGFDCTEVEYIDRVFEGAETLKAFLSLKNLGKSFTSVNTLDLSVLTNLNKDYYDGDCFEIIADSVYDFNVMNVNGISYSNVKLPLNVSQTAIDAWVSKGWRVLQ